MSDHVAPRTRWRFCSDKTIDKVQSPKKLGKPIEKQGWRFVTIPPITASLSDNGKVQPWMSRSVSPIESGDFPANHVSLLEGTLKIDGKGSWIFKSPVADWESSEGAKNLEFFWGFGGVWDRLFCSTVDGSEIPRPTTVWMSKPLVDTGVNNHPVNWDFLTINRFLNSFWQSVSGKNFRYCRKNAGFNRDPFKKQHELDFCTHLVHRGFGEKTVPR